MADRIHYTSCPICQQTELVSVFNVIDQLVSRESFTILECQHCGCRLTQGAPNQQASSKYYQSTDYISHSNTRQGLINRIYQLVRKRTLRQKVKWVEQATGLSSGRVLDVGSGTGAFVAALRRAGWQADGLEPDPSAREVAQADFGIALLGIDQLSQLPASSLDAITLWHVLEHVHDLNGYMQLFHRLLKPGGRLLIALPNYTSWDAQYFGKWWAAYDVPRHLYHFSPGSVQALSKRHQFEVAKIQPMWYDSFYISLLSNQHKHVSNRWLPSLLVGLKSNLRTWQRPECGSSLVYVIRPV